MKKINWKYIIIYFNPIRVFSMLLIILSLTDHLFNPFLHIGVDNSTIEIILRALFLFAGLYGMFGNGKRRRIRTTIIGFPFLYLATIYTIKLYQTGIQSIVLPLAIVSFLGVWIMLFGVYYEP